MPPSTHRRSRSRSPRGRTHYSPGPSRGDHDRYRSTSLRERDDVRYRGRSMSPSHEKDRGHARSRSRSREGRHKAHRSPSRSRSSSRPRRKRHRSRSISSSSSSSDDGRKRRRKERKRESSSKRAERKERKREKRERRREKKREKKERKKLKHAAGGGSWGLHGIISETDIYNKEQEFRTWLVEERKINPETISKDQNKKEFARFVEDYNTATLPHDKFYNMSVYEARMESMRSGATLPPTEDFYDPNADLKAHSSKHKRQPREAETYHTTEELQELRRVQKERTEIGKMKLLGMDVKQSFGVRMDGSQFE